jgi:hypothetical protein
MATTATYKTFKSYIKSLFGWASGGTTAASAFSLDDNIGTLTSRWVTYEVPQRKKASAEWTNVWGQTISLSLSQPLQERVIFTAFRDCELKAAHFCQFVSATVSATDTMSWTILLNKRGKTALTGTLSSTYSVTAYMGGLTSCSTKNGSVSGSQSALIQNVAFAPNRLLMDPSTAKRRMSKGDVITFRVKKGRSGVLNDSGATFQGGLLHLRIEED